MPFISRLKSYSIERAVPVCLLWFAIALGSIAVPPLLSALLDSKYEIPAVPFELFVDWRLLALLGLGIGVLLLVFSGLKRVMRYGPRESQYETEFFDRVWDEISGAATHVAFGTLALWTLAPYGKVGPPWGVLAYLVLGVFTMRNQASNAVRLT